MPLITLKQLDTGLSAQFSLSGDPTTLSRQLLLQGRYTEQGSFLSPSEGQDAVNLVAELLSGEQFPGVRDQLFPQARPLSTGDIVEVGTDVWLLTDTGWQCNSI